MTPFFPNHDEAEGAGASRDASFLPHSAVDRISHNGVMTGSDALLRLIGSAFRRYSREPETRTASARNLLSAAISLYADHTSHGEAALMVAETVATLAHQQRGEGSR